MSEPLATIEFRHKVTGDTRTIEFWPEQIRDRSGVRWIERKRPGRTSWLGVGAWSLGEAVDDCEQQFYAAGYKHAQASVRRLPPITSAPRADRSALRALWWGLLALAVIVAVALRAGCVHV